MQAAGHGACFETTPADARPPCPQAVDSFCTFLSDGMEYYTRLNKRLQACTAQALPPLTLHSRFARTRTGRVR